MKTKQWAALIFLALLPFISAYAQVPNPAAAGLSPAAAEVVKLAGAGTGEDVMQAYVQNAQVPFDLSADHVLYLKDLGVPSSVVAAMLTRDSALHAQAPIAAPAPMVEAPPPAAAPEPMAAPAAPPPPAPPAMAVAASTPPPDVGYFYNDLSPYGTWADLPGFGWCWQPSVVSVNVGWQPYCHAGHWMNTDAGWFWSSDYSWGWAPFHYGRWHQHPTAGWVWFPARQWAPAWVVWRSGGDHCGWAPLPPHADFVAGVGWRYNGVHVSAGFDFGLSVGCFSFVSMGHLCDHNVYAQRLPPVQVTKVYQNTTVINNYTYVNNTVVNHGVNVAVYEKASGQKLQQYKIQDTKSGGTGAAGGGQLNVPLRRQLGTPTPVTAMTALKVDNKGRIPATLPGSARLTGTGLKTTTTTGASTTAGGSGGAQGGVSKYSHTSGGVQKLGSDTTASKTPPLGTGVPPKHTSVSDAQAKTLSSSVHGTTLTGAQGSPVGGNTGTAGHVGVGNNPVVQKQNQVVNRPGGLPTGTAAGGGSSSSNPKLSTIQGTQTKAQTDHSPAGAQLHSDDLRGASGLMQHETKSTTYSAPGSGQKNLSGSSGNVGSGNSYNQSGAGNQRSGGGSSSSTSGAKGSTGSVPTKDVNKSGSGNSYNR